MKNSYAFWVITFLSLAIIVEVWQLNWLYNMPFKECNDYIHINYQIEFENTSKGELRSMINDLTEEKLYFYCEDNISAGGYSNPMFRLVVIKKNLSNYYYIVALTHELMHLKYNVRDERFVSYKTFTTLYESKFKNIALRFAEEQMLGRYTKEYTCYAQIYEYLKGVNNEKVN